MPVAVEKKVMFSPECLEKSPDIDASSVIFQTLVPRRRRDRWGRDTTSQSDYLLSATLFPTGVRAPALEELQQKCGPISRIENPRVVPRGIIASESWPGSGPKVLTLRKGKESPPDSHRSSQNRSEALHCNFRSYHWSQMMKKRDVRDPMYINTYCPDERPLRFKETSFPRITKGRPWSVGESNPSKRFVRVRDERKSAGQLTSKTRVQGTPLHPSREAFHTVANKEDSEQYFEVKRVSADERSRPRGQGTCLYSQVRQCIRLARNHDPRRGKKIERPMKSEIGKYRPFSTTRIRTPCASPQPHSSYKEHDSADTYRSYVITKALQTKMSGSRSAGTIASGVVARNNTAASTYFDVESQVVQSVADSNMPDSDCKTLSGVSHDSELGPVTRHQHDPLIMGLDIRGSTIVPPKSSKSKASDSDYNDKPVVTFSPKKEAITTRCRKRSKTSTKSGLSGHSDVSIPAEGLTTPRQEEDILPEPVPIQLDESGNPTIWQHDPLPRDSPDSSVIKIPAALSMLSIEDTEDTDTHDEGF
ncbi:uncharacterized protein [Haliotis cracherodii]|uniref:uncharacterized protein n=1 Tax=Haliotis cracherodii TaxID=6455 RepID=UPI0039EA92EC